MVSREVRVLMALDMAERIARPFTVEPGYALEAAARAYALREGELATYWLRKVLSCGRARALLSGMRAADRVIDEEIR